MAKHFVANVSDVERGTMKAFKVNGNKILVVNLEEGIFATDAKCPHLGAPLEKGKILDNCRIQCKFHRAEFDIKTGTAEKWANFPPGIQALNFVRGQKNLAIHNCSVEEDKIFVVM